MALGAILDKQQPKFFFFEVLLIRKLKNAAMDLQTLVEKRNMAIQAMVEEATQAPSHGHGGHQKGQLRPLHLMDFKDANLQEIDLTEEAVLATEGSQHFQGGLAAVDGSGSGAQA